MLGAFAITSGWGSAVAIIVLGAIAILWLVCLFMVIGDRMGPGAKLLWCVFLTILAPIAIPIYLLTRKRRMETA